jgi:PAS domain S-box-containing protein
VERRTDALRRANDSLRREIEERKKIEEDLRQSQARYASILNSQQTLVSRSDTRGRITYVNAAHRRLFGSDVGDSVLIKVHPDDIEPTRLAMEALQRPPFYCTLEQRCEVLGQWRTLLWQVGVIRDRSGAITEYQGVAFDISDRRRAEELLRDSERRALEAAEFNSRLVREVDHRVRNNIAGLLSLVSAMRDSRGGGRRPRDLDTFADAIEGRLLALAQVHQLLAETNWRSVDLKALVTSLLAAVDRLCAFRTPALIDGPPVPVSPRQATPLSMILLEWFTNSCKYGAHSLAAGRVNVRWTVEGRAPAAQVRLKWTETGGPRPRGSRTPSLGTELVKGFATRELRGRCELCYPEAGADHELEFPLE